MSDSTTTITTDAEQAMYTEPIVELCGKPALVRALVVLNDAAGTPLTVADIASQADIDKRTFYNNRDTLTDYDLIEEGEKAGNAQTYQFNMTSDTGQAFIQLRDTLIDATNN